MSQKPLESIATQQQWSGEEPALQLLVLPATSGPPLPTYSESPEYLNPNHCRLCFFEAVDDLTLQQHLEERHGLTLTDYRSDVLSRTMAEWPQPISPQILRCRLAAFKNEMCDHNF